MLNYSVAELRDIKNYIEIFRTFANKLLESNTKQNAAISTVANSLPQNRVFHPKPL